MKTSITHVAIPDPCAQNWDSMHNVAGGRFCDSCQKTVTDFSNLSNNEIITLLASSKNLCGRFDDGQLVRVNQQLQSAELSYKSLFLKVAATVIATFSFTTLKAQTTAKSSDGHHKTVRNTQPDFEQLVNLPVKADKIVGKVTDINGKPIPGVSVKLSNTETSEVTDINGDFIIKSPTGENGKIISFTLKGYLPQDISMNSFRKEYNVVLQEQLTECATTMISGTVGGLIIYRASFVKRAWRTITWPFRAIF